MNSKSWEQQAVDEIIAKEEELEALDLKIARYQVTLEDIEDSMTREILENRYHELCFERGELAREIYGDEQ